MQSTILKHPKIGAFEKRAAQRRQASLDSQLSLAAEEFSNEVANLQETTSMPAYVVHAQKDDNRIHLFLRRESGLYQNPQIRTVGLSTVNRTDKEQTNTYLQIEDEFIPIDLSKETPNALLRARRMLNQILSQEYQKQQTRLEEVFAEQAPQAKIICTGADVLNAYHMLNESTFQKQTFPLPKTIEYHLTQQQSQ